MEHNDKHTHRTIIRYYRKSRNLQSPLHSLILSWFANLFGVCRWFSLRALVFMKIHLYGLLNLEYTIPACNNNNLITSAFKCSHGGHARCTWWACFRCLSSKLYEIARYRMDTNALLVFTTVLKRLFIVDICNIRWPAISYIKEGLAHFGFSSFSCFRKSEFCNFGYFGPSY